MRAIELVDNSVYPRRFKDDTQVKLAWRYLSRWDPENRQTLIKLSNEHPILHDAHMLYQDADTGCRWIFEAGVMADRPVTELAEYLNADAEVLKMYEGMFFDVRNALKHRGCIIGSVLMPATKGGAVPHDPDFFYKMLAYHGGWDIVKAIWETGSMTPAARDFYQRTFAEQTLKTGWMAAHSVRVNNYNAPELMGRCLDLIKHEHEAGSAQSRDQAQFSLKSLLGDINIAVVRTREQVPAEEQRPYVAIDAPIAQEMSLPDAEAIYAKAAQAQATEKAKEMKADAESEES